MAGLAGHHTGALDGLLDAAALAQQRPETVVVVAAAALPTHQSPAAVQEKLQELAGAAPAALRLPNAENLVRSSAGHSCAVAQCRHEQLHGQVAIPAPRPLLTPPLAAPPQGESHPVFAALRRSASKLRVRVLGDCGGSYVPAALPATAAALRTALAAPRDAAAPATRVVVMCLPAAGEDEAAAAASEAALLAEVAAAVGQASPASHLLVHTQRPASAGETESARRRLLAADSSAPAEGGKVAVGADRANQTSNYTNCDPVCHKHVRARPCCPAGCRPCCWRWVRDAAAAAAAVAAGILGDPAHGTLPHAAATAATTPPTSTGGVDAGPDRCGGHPAGPRRGLLLHARGGHAQPLRPARGRAARARRLSWQRPRWQRWQLRLPPARRSAFAASAMLPLSPPCSLSCRILYVALLQSTGKLLQAGQLCRRSQAACAKGSAARARGMQHQLGL